MPPSEDPTRTSDTASRGAASPLGAGEGSPGRAGFEPGAVLAGRYRIVNLLGRGGMGEVYRADDLKLEQPVALKLLPERLAQDPVRLSRLLNEVRTARQVTHPNVCRVHDVGEADGQHFLSMEYVDGEDLASLLRRAGRLNLEKGVELARQIALGLGAAHERGVLHRDLKPANVMVDGRGRARLTDFGLALPADAAARSVEISGTPAYMAPEQLEGRGASERSDVYALGLTLYEMFTGGPAFRATTLPELVRLKRESAPAPPSSHVRELDPALERLILRCLDKDPSRRPGSAIAVAAALPGGDPLQALLAAGQTPPPDLVAATGGSERVALAPAWAAFALVVLGLPPAIGMLERLTTLHAVPLDKPPEVLIESARRAARLVVAAPGKDSAWGFEQDAAAPPASRLRLWYREAPRRLEPLDWRGRVTPDDPPVGSGMVRVRVDSEGRLLELVAAPGPAPLPSQGEPDWNALLTLTGLDPTTLRAAVPQRVPPVFGDRRLAWADADEETRVEAGAFGTQPVFITTVPETPSDSDVTPSGFALLWFIIIVFGGVLAVRNLRLGRGDRQGAWRVAAWAGAARLLVWLLLAPHTAELGREQVLFIQGVRGALFSAAQIWLLYIAIEPAIRRRWPTCLVSWTRLLQGRWRDPLVGRDVLAGIAGAVTMGLLWTGARVISGGAQNPVPVVLDHLLGLRGFLAWMLANLIGAVATCLWLLVIVIVCRWMFRDFRLAAVATAVLLTAMAASGIGVAGPIELGAVIGVAVLLAALLLRFGMLAVVTTSFFLGSPGQTLPATLSFSAWHGQAALGWLLTGYAVAAFGLYVATGGRPFPRSELLDD